MILLLSWGTKCFVWRTPHCCSYSTLLGANHSREQEENPIGQAVLFSEPHLYMSSGWRCSPWRASAEGTALRGSPAPPWPHIPQDFSIPQDFTWLCTTRPPHLNVSVLDTRRGQWWGRSEKLPLLVAWGSVVEDLVMLGCMEPFSQSWGPVHERHDKGNEQGRFQRVKLIKLENNTIHDNKRFGKARWFDLKETSKNSDLKA